MAGVGTSAATERVALVPETNWGVAPATPAFQNFRFTSESLTGTKTTTQSNEVRPDRNVSDDILTGITGQGNIETEFSYGSFDAYLAALFQGTWTDDVLVNGVLEQYFTAEKTFDNPTGGKIYQRFGGLMFNTLSLNLASQSIITGSWGTMSKTVETGTSIITGATYADASVSEVMSSGAHVGSLALSGDTLGGDSPVIESMTIDITNNLRGRNAVGYLGYAGIGSGRFQVSGTMNAYFSSLALLEAFLNHDDVALEFMLGRDAGSMYKINMNRMKLSTGTVNGGGNDADVMMNMGFTALIDTTVGGTMRVERAL